MARIRTIKPEFWTHEKTTACSRDARLLFIGLWNFADDSGRAHDSSREFKMRILPGDEDITSAHVEAWLVELASARLIQRYEVDGRRYIQIVGWDHQKIQHPSESKIPSPPEPSEILTSPHESSLLKGREGKGKDYTPTETSSPPGCEASPSAPASPPSKARGTRLPDDWGLPPDWRAYAVGLLTGRGVSEGSAAVWATQTAEAFRDHWWQSSRPTAVKRDWLAAWRVWVRKEISDGRIPAVTQAPVLVAAGPPEKRLREATLDEQELARRVRKVCGRMTCDADVAEWRRLDEVRAA